MKHWKKSVLALLHCTLLWSHGFSGDTLVLLANDGWQQISTVCYRTQKKKIAVASYNTSSSYQTTAKTTRGGRSKSNCYITFAFADELRRNDHAIARERATAGGFEKQLKNTQHHHEVACTPTQEFYSATTHQWVPAYMLKIGDELLCANNTTKVVASTDLIKEQLDIFSIEVKHTHTFFVTQHSLLTHNMVLPIAFNVGLSIPFGASAGGAAGSFFGPATFVVGAAVGCIVGALVKMAYDGHIPRYTIDAYEVNTFEQHIKKQPHIATYSELEVALSSEYKVTPENTDTLSAGTCNAYRLNENDTGEPSLTIIIPNLPKEKPGCGDTTPQKPLILITPAEPMSAFKNPCYRPLSDAERKMLTGGCTLIPIPDSERWRTIICGGITPVTVDTSNIILTMATQDTKNERYNGPTYNRTEDWIKNHPLSDDAKEAFERTNKGFQGKRAFRLKKNIPEITGISEGDHVVIDAAHGDHLEVYNERGKWTHVAKFDGSKNEKKTDQGKNEPRKPLQLL